MKTALTAIVLSLINTALLQTSALSAGGSKAHQGGYPIGTSSSGPVHQTTNLSGYPIGTGASGHFSAAAVGGYPIGTDASPINKYPLTSFPNSFNRHYGYRYGYYGYPFPLTGAGQVPAANNGATQQTPTYYDHSLPPTPPQEVLSPSHPSMSLTIPKPASGPFDQEFNALARGRVRTPVQRVSEGTFNADTRAQVGEQLSSAAKLFSQYKESGRLGTLDVPDLQAKLNELYNEQDNLLQAAPENLPAMETKLRQDIADFQMQLHGYDQ